MLVALALASLCLSTCPVTAVPQASEPDYFAGLLGNLTEAGLGSFAKALTAANTTQRGHDLIHNLYSDSRFTLYVPVDDAWETSGLSEPPASEDLNSLLSYHIVTTAVNSTTDVAAPRKHTIASTLLDTSTVILPGGQTQVIVLESAPSGPDNTILVRGDNWNATSVGSQFTYENLRIQPIDKILEVPSPLLKTLSKSGLALSANLGATSFVTAVSAVGLNNTLQGAPGYTFFVPINSAFESLNANYDTATWTTLIRDHILNGTVAYSTVINPGDSFATATGSTIACASNATGKYLTGGSSTAKIVRADIPVSNGVVHLIDRVLSNTVSNSSQTSSAAHSTTSVAATSNQSSGSMTSAVSAGSSSGNPSSTSTGSALPSLSKGATLDVLVLAALAWAMRF